VGLEHIGSAAGRDLRSPDEPGGILSIIEESAATSTPGGALHVIAEPDNMIDAAVEVLMVRHQVSREEAADLLEQAAGERELGEVAEDVVLIGLPDLNTRIELRPVPPSEPSSAPQDLPAAPELPATAVRPSIDAVATRLLDLLVEMATLPALLEKISELAVAAVPGCESASVTVVADGAAAMVASRDKRAKRIDQLQYRTGEGPYLQAAHTNRPVHIDNLSTEPSDHAWRQLAQESGFTAVLSVPIDGSEDIAAGISLYTSQGTGWPPESVDIAEAFAAQAGKAISLAYRLTGPVPGPEN
jgi:GAF domain-containing protein